MLTAGLALAFTATGTLAYEDHVVQPGETLSSIAAQYGFPIDTLAEVNGLTSADAIYVGQVIRIPGRASSVDAYTDTPSTSSATGSVVASGQTHAVSVGETLSGIADQYGVTLDKWVALNGLANPDAIYVGETLQVPANGSTAATVPDAPTTPITSPTGSSGETHTVAVGETLSLIADLYSIPVPIWVQVNNLTSADAIYVGEVLQVPATASPPAPVSTTGAVPSGRTHTVQAGETLSFIADHYNIPLAQWVELNHLVSEDAIFVGQELDIPSTAGPAQGASFTHAVQAGETLASIAATYGISVDELMTTNGISNPNLITVGEQLSVPGPVCRPADKGQYQVALENAAAEYGISASVLLGLSWHESGFQQCIVSNANAYGLTQVTPATAQWAFDIGLSDAYDYQVNYIANARLGAAIMRDHLIEANWDLRTALAAYYQGFDALYAVGMYDETRVYVDQVLAAIALFE